MDTAPRQESLATLVIVATRHATPGLPEILTQQGFSPWICEARAELPSLLTLRRWDLLLIDMECPAAWGPERCSSVREVFSGPLAAVTRGCGETTLAKILEAGVDDVMAWPLAAELLGARLRALVRRSGIRSAAFPSAEAPLKIGGLVVDPARREVSIEGRRIELTGLEFTLLHMLALNAGAPVSREELSRELRGLPYDGRDRSIDLRVCRLRQKLGEDGERARFILTVRGIGYQLAAGTL